MLRPEEGDTAVTDQNKDARSFASEAEQKSPGMLSEFWGLLKTHKKWWLAPIIVVLLIVGGLVLLFGTPVAPLIYTLF